MTFHKDSFHQRIGRFSKKLNISRGEIRFSASYDNDYLTISINEYSTYMNKEYHVPIFEGKISLKTELDESGEIILPDWIRVISNRKESEYHKRHGGV